jgi:nucleoside-diphosphate-sugar epimerase
MSKIKVFCFGFGQVAERFVNKLIKEKKDLDLAVTSRDQTHQIEYNNFRMTSFFFKDDKCDESLKLKLEEANYILISIPPVDGKDIVVKYLDTNFKNLRNCRWITYLSATSVYGDHKGNWVNEESITKPTSPSGINRLKAENSWTNLSKKINLPLQIFRLAGIYSKKFNILSRLKTGKAQIVDKKNHFFQESMLKT